MFQTLRLKIVKIKVIRVLFIRLVFIEGGFSLKELLKPSKNKIYTGSRREQV